jgi:hypothetical protein
MKVLLAKGIEQPVMAEPRMSLMQPLDLCSHPLVDGVVLTRGHA